MLELQLSTPSSSLRSSVLGILLYVFHRGLCCLVVHGAEQEGAKNPRQGKQGRGALGRVAAFQLGSTHCIPLGLKCRWHRLRRFDHTFRGCQLPRVVSLDS